MNQPIKTLSLLVAFTLCCVSLSYAATPKKGYDKYGNPLPGFNTPTVQEFPTGPKPVHGTGPMITEEANPINTTVTPIPYHPACSIFEDYKNAAQEIQVIELNGGAQACPAGYKCNRPRLLVPPDCVKDSSVTSVYGDDPTNCTWHVCNPSPN